MNKIKPLEVLSFLSISICASVFIWFQPIQSNIVMAESNSLLILEVSSPKLTYLQREPIPLDFKLSNQSTSITTWVRRLSYPNLNFISRSESGVEIRWVGEDHSVADRIPSAQTIGEGETITKSELIGMNLVKKLFPSPGRYELRVEVQSYTYGQQQTIVSSPISIDINEPNGNNRKAYEYLKNVYEPIENNGNSKDLLHSRQYFVDNLPNNVYWKYMTFNLADIYFATGQDEKAEREYLKISDIEFYYSKKINQRFTILVRKLGRDRRTPKPGRIIHINDSGPIPIPVPTPVPIPLPDDAPVLISVPNPSP